MSHRLSFSASRRTLLVAMAASGLGVGAVLGGCGGGDDEPLRIVRSATLSGAQEFVPTASPATGRGAAVVNADTREISGGMTFTGIPPSAGGHHIHQAPSGAPK